MTKKNTTDEKIEEDDEVKETDANEEELEVENLREKFEEAENSYKRALADYQNLQKRVADERRDLILTANRDLLLRILSVLDTLILANKHDESEGLKVSINKFLDVLKSEGLTKIETVGKDFNPQIMEAIAIEDGEEGKVLEEIQSGYLLNGKLLRAALVKVGKSEIQNSKHETN